MRRYDDSVEVRRDGAEAPEQFLWRGRLWKVRAVLARWVDAGASRPPAERETWRVEAGRGGLEPDGVFDLSFDTAVGRWSLVGSAD